MVERRPGAYGSSRCRARPPRPAAESRSERHFRHHHARAIAGGHEVEGVAHGVVLVVGGQQLVVRLEAQRAEHRVDAGGALVTKARSSAGRPKTNGRALASSAGSSCSTMADRFVLQLQSPGLLFLQHDAVGSEGAAGFRSRRVDRAASDGHARTSSPRLGRWTPAQPSITPRPRWSSTWTARLVDTVETRIRAWLGVFEEFGIPASRELVAPMIGIDGKRLARDAAEAAGRPLPPGRDEDRPALWRDLRVAQSGPQALLGARALLGWLDGAGLAVGNRDLVPREQVGTSLAALGLGRDPTIVDGSSVAHAKPAPDLLLARPAGGAAAVELLVRIGDSTWDMRAATAAGMAIGVTAGSAVPALALREAGARWFWHADGAQSGAPSQARKSV